ncbi:hypothetical protein EJ377_05040 [Chryseobacterium arthrosphaerae]|uniref:Uncharacterized protein n=1 Tax=Chryseobacterium arthrosphaerae TaxID=651561 RepID=A0A432DZM1_9FLAO|nr:hypothetical protein EJ377_05040 [Chryseobacterium arthrosphaerae]
MRGKFLFSSKDSLTLRIERNGQNITVTAKTYPVKDIIREKTAFLINGNFWMLRRKPAMLIWSYRKRRPG